MTSEPVPENMVGRMAMLDEGSAETIDVGHVIRGYGRHVADEFREGSGTMGDEEAVRALLSRRLPKRYGVGHGVVVDTRGAQTRKFNGVIFDQERLPLLGDGDVTIWPFESVYAATEVRPRLTRDGLQQAVENIAAFKGLQREKQTSTTAGLTISGEVLNPPVGLLVACDTDADLVPSDAAFKDLVCSVDPHLQLDAYCIVSGSVGCLGQEVPRLGLLLGFSNQGPTKLFHFNFGTHALGGFLLMVTAILNKIKLGDPSLLQYLRTVAP
jgi:hypothetical protein